MKVVVKKRKRRLKKTGILFLIFVAALLVGIGFGGVGIYKSFAKKETKTEQKR